MFTITAEFRDKVEVKANLEKVREFLFDLQNFARMMPEVESIRADAKGNTLWTITVEIPVIGKIRESFSLEPEEISEQEIIWRPAAGEKKNLLRYMVLLAEKSEGVTLVQISQKVELRRDKAKELHSLASLAGEKLISKEMTRRVTQLIKEFLRKAKEKLER
jgi:carbon monoxide dehydrogenase subunit G